MCKNIGKNISKNWSGKYSQKLPDHAKQSVTDALKTASKNQLSHPKMLHKQLKVKSKERYISPEEKQQIIDKLRLIW